MSVTYEHDYGTAPDCPPMNPNPLAHDALVAVSNALALAAIGRGPLVRWEQGTDHLAEIMGAKLSPSPELHGAGAGVLEIDYQDGTTRTFDVSSTGDIERRRYAYAVAAVIETDEPRPDENGGEQWHDAVLRHIGRALPSGFPGEVVYCSTPQPRPLNTGEYDVRPENDHA